MLFRSHQFRKNPQNAKRRRKFFPRGWLCARGERQYAYFVKGKMNRDEERRKVFSLCYGQQRKRKLSCSKQLQLRAFRALFQSLTCPGMCFHTKTCSGLAPQHFPIPFIPCMHFQIFIFPSVTSSKQDSLTGQQFRSRYIFL